MRALIEAVTRLFETDDEDPDRDIFTAGHCHALAIALHRKTGLPMVALLARESRRWAIIHVMVARDEDTFIDIDGERELHDILWDADIDPDEVSTKLQDVDEVTLRKWVGRGLVAISPETARRADAAADRVLSKLDQP